MKTFVVIGLGRFGSAVATELAQLGHEVLAVDLSRDAVQQVADQVTHAVAGDARDPAVLRALGVRNYDCAVVALGDDVGSAALITLNLKEQGVKKVVCKAQSHVQRRLLEKIGADRVVFPEHEMGVKLAQTLAHSNVLNFIELSPDYGIIEVAAPHSWLGRTIRDVDVRNRYKVNIIALRDSVTGEINVSPGGDHVLCSSDMLIVLGEDQHTNAIHSL